MTRGSRERLAAGFIDRDILTLALVLGLGGGLIEGGGHMALQKLKVLENAWYPIIWIAAFVNGLLLAGLGLAVSLVLSRFPDRPALRSAAGFTLALAAFLPCFALMLKEWMKPYAIFLVLIGITVAFTRWWSRSEATIARLARRSLPWVVAAVLAAYFGIQGGSWWLERRGTAKLPPANPSAPDILVVIIDTFRADHASAYGYHRPTTPNLERLAREGVLFEQALSTSSYTLPSHASILTGLYPSEHGVEWSTSHRLRNPPYPTLAETMQQLGYRTGAFSANTFYFAREHGFGRGFLRFEDYFHSITDMVMRTAYGRIVATKVLPRLGYLDTPGRKLAVDVNQAVLRWTAADRTRPAFVVINYLDTHDPYLPPEPFRSRFSKEPGPGGILNGNLRVPPRLPPDQLQSEIDAYDGAIAYVDDQLNRLVGALEERDPSRDLLLVVTSDHGEEFYEHGGFLHGSHLYREVIHVPLIVRYPGKVPAGLRVSQPVTNGAIPATVIDLLGEDPTIYPGPSLGRLWDAPEPPADWPPALAELKQRPWAPEREPVRHGNLKALVSPKWHYIENDGAGRELFDWVNDPAERNDLGSTPAGQPIIEDLRDQLRALSSRLTRNVASHGGGHE